MRIKDKKRKDKGGLSRDNQVIIVREQGLNCVWALGKNRLHVQALGRNRLRVQALGRNRLREWTLGNKRLYQRSKIKSRSPNK